MKARQLSYTDFYAVLMIDDGAKITPLLMYLNLIVAWGS